MASLELKPPLSVKDTKASSKVAVPPSFRRRQYVSTSVQTESSFPPDCESIESHYEELASEQFSDLCKLRDVIRAAMREMACSVFDVVAFKDVLFKIEDDLPSTLPVTDMLLLSSKLFRRTAELGRLLTCFFAVTFAEEHVDEHFRFTEVRVLRRELAELKRRVTKAEEERARLQFMLDDVGRVAMSHSRAVELLESRNAALQLQSSGLEDQMALLFSQLNKDIKAQCSESYEAVSSEIDAQYRMNLTKATFRQTMDSLSDQLRTSRTLINDVRELVATCTQGYSGKNADAQIAKEPSIRFKLKQVESNFQQLIGRFTSIKGIVAETAHELMSALQERKNILYLSLQHIRLYDIQNTKMRQSKAVLIDMKRFIEEYLKRIHLTFPAGAVTYVDRIGHISTQQWQIGQTLATIRNQRGSPGLGDHSRQEDSTPSQPQQQQQQQSQQQPQPQQQQQQPVVSPLSTAAVQSVGVPGSPAHPAGELLGDTEALSADPPMPLPTPAAAVDAAPLPSHTDEGPSSSHSMPFDTIHNAFDIVKSLDRAVENLNRILSFENETNAFLQALTLSLSMTPREVEGVLGEFANTAERELERALLPTGDGTARVSRGDSLSRPPEALGVDATSRANPTPGLDMPRLVSANSATTTASAAATAAEEAAQAALLLERERKITKLQEQLDTQRVDFASKLGFLRQVYEARISDLEVKEANIQKEIHSATPTKDLKKRVPGQTVAGEYDERQRKRGDMDALIMARSEWNHVKQAMQPNKKVRERILGDVQKLSEGKQPSQPKKRSSSEKRSAVPSDIQEET